MAADALLAFRAGDRDADGEWTDEARTGATLLAGFLTGLEPRG